jgi:ribosomal peptide maturation radical SAM protein 1
MTSSGRPGSPDICLVNMPYAALTLPPIGLGLLKGALDRSGIRATVANANLWFAESAGLERYRLCSERMPMDCLAGEWTFAGVAFGATPDWEDRDNRYLRFIRLTAESGRIPRYGRDGGEDLLTDLRELRAAATAFIDVAARRILDTGARAVGCTSTFEQHVASLALLRRIRELDPDVITLMGGANCETVMGQTTHRCFPWVDYVVSGEADGLIAGLCRLVLDKGRDTEPGDLPRGVLGPCHRDQPSARRTSLPRAMFRDLDSLPLPDFGDYFTELTGSPLRPYIRPGLPLETSRGCWWGASHQCTFCGLNGSSMAYDSKSPDRVLEEVRELEERYGISDFEVVDNILDMAYFKNVLPNLAADGRRRRLFYEVKANLGRAQIEALVQAGVTWVQPGIESLHSEVLSLMDKGVRGWQNVQLLKWAREFGLGLSWSFLWGFPGERDAYYSQMAGWLPLLEHLPPPTNVNHLRYDRYSVYHQQAQKTGLVLLPIPAMGLVYPVAPADLGDLAYFFTAASDSLGAAAPSGEDRLARRPGVRALQRAVGHWHAEFRDRLHPVLSLTDRDGELEILDSRDCARAFRITLRGLARAVCLACDAAPPAHRLTSIVERDYGLSATDEEVGKVADELIADRLVLPIDGRLVGLAVRGNLPTPPDMTRFPGGHIDDRPEAVTIRTSEAGQFSRSR